MSGRGPGRAYGARPPSHVAYFVALGGVVLLLALLLLYCVYYCCSKVKELKDEELSPVSSATPKPYPVQPGVREGAQAMAKICRQLPPNVKSNLTAPNTPRDLVSPSTVDTSVASRTDNSDSSKTDTSNVAVTSQATATSHDHDVSETSQNDTFTSTSKITDDRDVIIASKATLNSNVLSMSFAMPADTSYVSKIQDCKNTSKSNTQESQESITNVTSLSLITSENSISLSTAAVCGSDFSEMSHISDVRYKSSDIFDDDKNLLSESHK